MSLQTAGSRRQWLESMPRARLRHECRFARRCAKTTSPRSPTSARKMPTCRSLTAVKRLVSSPAAKTWRPALRSPRRVVPGLRTRRRRFVDRRRQQWLRAFFVRLSRVGFGRARRRHEEAAFCPVLTSFQDCRTACRTSLRRRPVKTTTDPTLAAIHRSTSITSLTLARKAEASTAHMRPANRSRAAAHAELGLVLYRSSFGGGNGTPLCLGYVYNQQILKFSPQSPCTDGICCTSQSGGSPSLGCGADAATTPSWSVSLSVVNPMNFYDKPKSCRLQRHEHELLLGSGGCSLLTLSFLAGATLQTSDPNCTFDDSSSDSITLSTPTSVNQPLALSITCP